MSESPLQRLTTALADRYAIERELGEGGMATVYLAQDLKHQRRVALKVLKPELSAVVGAERFLTEIQTTANLQHPHILPLFDSGEADGLLFYVMPYVEGETLRERLEREKQLPIDDGVRIATAIAGALDYAHRHGVVHRDIKPANILVHDGQPVVSDFGIALAVGAGGARLTETGLSVGTPYYMSPEQATGDQRVGPASDIYSLGCVLYEMLVGEPPFIGNTAQAVLGKIIQGGPVSATSARRSVPGNIDATIRKALEKLPADRFASAQDFGRALGDRSFRHGAEAGGSGSPRWKQATIGLALASVVLLTGLLWSVFGRQEAPAGVERFASPFLEGQEPAELAFRVLAISPDGSFLVYRSGAALWLRRWEDLEATQIRGGTQGWTPSISPDGRAVAFWVDTGEIKIASLDGGPVQTLLSEVLSFVHWGRDGFIYARTRDRRIVRTPPGGGTVDTLWVMPESGNDYVTDITADGNQALVMTVGGSLEGPEVSLVDLETGAARPVLPGAIPRLLPSGEMLYLAADSSVMVAPLDTKRGALRDDPVVVAEDVLAFVVADDGTIFYTSGDATAIEFELVWVTREGSVTPVQSGWSFDPDIDNRGWTLSPDNRSIALKARTDLGSDIWVKELPEGPMTRLTFHEAEDRMPRWHPDGSRVSFVSGRDGAFHTYTRRADGAGEATPISGTEGMADHAWSPDGTRLVMRVTGPTGVPGGRDLHVIRPGTDTVPTPLLASEYDEFGPAVSPDGKWIAYTSDETGQREVFVRPFPEVNSAKVQISDGGGRGAVWSPKGTEIFYVTDGPTVGEGRSFMVAELRPGPPMAVLRRRTLFDVPEDIYFANYTTSVDVTADGQRFLMARAARQEAPERRRFVLVKNWLREYRARQR